MFQYFHRHSYNKVTSALLCINYSEVANTQNKPLSHNCSNSMHLLFLKKSRFAWQITECILIKALSSLSHSHSVSVSLMSGCKVSGKNMSALTAATSARPGWVALNEVSGSLLPTSVFGCITSFPPFTCMQDWPYFELSIMLQRQADNSDFFSSSFFFWGGGGVVFFGVFVFCRSTL